jgi:hypothetical protein
MFYVRGRIAVNSALIEKWGMSFVACCKLCPTFFLEGLRKTRITRVQVSGDLDQDVMSRFPGLLCDSLTSRLAECLAN